MPNYFLNEWDDVIIGSNSYLGVNICLKTDRNKTLLISRGENDPLNKDFAFRQEDLLKDFPAEGLRTNRMFILARPVTTDYKELIGFYSNLKMLTLYLLKKNEALTIHFISSSLLFESENPEAKTTTSATDLKEPYEYFKYEFEQFLHHLSLRYTEASVNIHRIPLLMGGKVREQELNFQLFYYWYNLFNAGKMWVFNKEERQMNYGTSWLYIPDFSEWLLRGEFSAGKNIWLPSSGDISYWDFFAICRKKMLYKPMREALHFPHSYLYLENNTTIQVKNFELCFHP